VRSRRRGPSATGTGRELSDLAAHGRLPPVRLLSLVLPPALPLADFTALVDGFLALAAVHGVALVGGNIARSPGPLVVDVTAWGRCGAAGS